jgi:hypothetical protein
MPEIHCGSDARTWKTMFEMSKGMRERQAQDPANERTCFLLTKQIF